MFSHSLAMETKPHAWAMILTRSPFEMHVHG
uniref:Uncharacterized protein n=1 Tax=Anguilla anguilla TaxID=7936 RepID=A0A0E9V9C0_ANGAN